MTCACSLDGSAGVVHIIIIEYTGPILVNIGDTIHTKYMMLYILSSKTITGHWLVWNLFLVVYTEAGLLLGC